MPTLRMLAVWPMQYNKLFINFFPESHQAPIFLIGFILHSQENTSFLMSLLETHNHNPMLACPVSNVAFLLNSPHSTYLIYIPPHVQVVQVGRCNTFEFDILDIAILINLRVVCQASQNFTLDFRGPLA